MKNELVIKFLECVQANDAIKEELQKNIEGKSIDEAIKCFVELAPKLDFNITEEDLKEYFEKSAQNLKERTDATIAKVEAIDASELEAVAGGYYKGEHPNCGDTFKDRENCWFNDGCDITLNKYSNYQCYNTNEGADCGAKSYFGCKEFLICDLD